MQKASKELIKDKMCLKEDPGRLGWSHCFDPPCKGVGEPSQPGAGGGAGWHLLGQHPPFPGGSRRILCEAGDQPREEVAMAEASTSMALSPAPWRGSGDSPAPRGWRGPCLRRHPRRSKRARNSSAAR